MLGVRSANEPITGHYAEELMLKIVDMTLHPVKVDKEKIKFHFDWSEIDKERFS